MAVSLLTRAAKAEVGHAAVVLSRRLATIAAGTTQRMRGGLPLSAPARVLIVEALVRPFGVIGGGVFVIVWIVPISTPLPHISRHVVETVGVGRVGFDSSRGIRRFEDASVIGLLFVGRIVAPGIFGLGAACAASVFPLGFGGQGRPSQRNKLRRVWVILTTGGVPNSDIQNQSSRSFG